jgi:hypothetical protein
MSEAINEVIKEINASEEKMKSKELSMDGIYDMLKKNDLTDEEKVVFIAAMTSGQVVGSIVKKSQYIMNNSVYEIVDGKLVDVDPPTEITAGGKYWKNAQGKLHRDNDLPAEIDQHGNMWWYKNGKYARANNKPTHVYIDGTQKWHNGKYFTFSKWADGSERYYTDNGKVTKRTAAIYPATYYFNDNADLHNTDEPTIINGKKIWYTNNVPTRIE